MDKRDVQKALFQAVQERESAQKNRVAYELRIQAVERGDDTASDILLRRWKSWHDRFEEHENIASEEIKELALDFQIIEIMCGVKGVGTMLAAKLVSQIDIERAKTVSALWRYCGYGCDENGERDRPKKGEKLVYNKKAKAIMHLIGVQLLRKGPYRQIYENAREKYETEQRFDDSGKEWTKGHYHMAALRKVKKLFLAHLWEVWRELEGLPIRPAYILEHGGHTHKHKPRDFGWLV
jgi:hypothetical protein